MVIGYAHWNTIKQNTKEVDEFLGSHDMFFHVFFPMFYGIPYVYIYIC